MISNAQITSLIRDYENVYRLGNKQESQTHVLFKYMSVEYAIKFLETGILRFVEPSSWMDPFEVRFYNADYRCIAGFIPPRVYCSCFTQQRSNEAAWRMYSQGSNGIAARTIRFEFSRSEFLHVLDRHLKMDGEKIYVGNVIYDYSSQQISGIHKRKNRLYSHFFNSFSLEKFLLLLLLKRKAFAYEEEVRLFIVDKDKRSAKTQEKLIEFSRDDLSRIIKTIFIDPQCSNLEYDMIKTKVNKVLPGCHCSRHNLYQRKAQITIE